MATSDKTTLSTTLGSTLHKPQTVRSIADTRGYLKAQYSAIAEYKQNVQAQGQWTNDTCMAWLHEKNMIDEASRLFTYIYGEEL